MKIKELLYNELIIIKITEFLSILEIQNMIISLRINVKTNIYFLRECLSLMHLDTYGYDHNVSNKNTPNKNINISTTEPLLLSSSVNLTTDIDDYVHNATSYVEDQPFLQQEGFNLITYDDEYDEYIFNDYNGDNNNNDINNYNNNNNNNYSVDNMHNVDSMNSLYNYNNHDIYNNTNYYNEQNDENFNYNTKYSHYENTFNDMTHLITTHRDNNINYYDTNKTNFGALYEIKKYLNFFEQEKEGHVKKCFNNVWMYIHLKNELIDIKKNLETYFMRIKTNTPINRNKKIRIDIFQLFKYNHKYYSYYDMPWVSIYYDFFLNSICTLCNIKLDHTSICLFSENFNLIQTNDKLLNYINSMSDDIVSSIKNEKKRDHEKVDMVYEEDIEKKKKKKTDTIKYHNNNKSDSDINVDNNNNNSNNYNNNECNNDNIYNHQHDYNIDENIAEIKLNEDIFSCQNKTNTYDEEFIFIRRTHIFCEECTKIIDYKMNINSLLESIKKDYELLKSIRIINKIIDIPSDLFCFCNYFFFKEKYITFFKNVSNDLQNLRKALKKKLTNNFILNFSINFYKFVISSLILCDEKKLFSQENIFLFGFYIKYRNILKLFSSPRCTHIYFSFNIIYQKIVKFQSFFKHKHFSKLSKVLHFDVITILEKLKHSKTKMLYKNIAVYLYQHLNHKILSKCNYDQAYTYFFQCLQRYHFS
ncbi:hypothetical protein PGSY75_1365300 [Plasmodium gaboni]|uniref:Uncharacterized protein n=1 Tax=Plasmodium gaboni TaxID=647221 RepID=A0A151LEQ0_9APIC|nr:hypothetical protein PGSY75_1365300 [Plasmodium gaboni]KYN97409.1 hypothetical protein PGSY75_1365300 [Plasmodium gaboni]